MEIYYGFNERRSAEHLQGREKVWQCIKDNLPDDIVCYFNREVKGREFDFSLLIKNIGFVIIEVKGWNKHHISEVISPDEIIMKDDSVKASPKEQAKSYSYNLKSILNEKYNINPLVLDLVCYPFISKVNYDKLRLSVVSEPEFTLFSEDIESTRNFANMILDTRSA